MNLDVIRPCVGSGLCCQQGPCGFGAPTSPTNPACKFLEVESQHGEVTIYRCGKYAEIVGQPGAQWSPAFGAGCCMPLFNAARQRIVRLLQQGPSHELSRLLDRVGDCR